MTHEHVHESPCIELCEVQRAVAEIKASNTRFTALMFLMAALSQGATAIQVERMRAVPAHKTVARPLPGEELAVAQK